MSVLSDQTWVILSLNLSHNITITSDPNTWVWSDQIHISPSSCLNVFTGFLINLLWYARSRFEVYQWGCNRPNLAPSPYNGAKMGWVHSHIEPTMPENCKVLSKNSLVRWITNVVRIPSKPGQKEGSGLMLLFNGLGRGWRELEGGHNSFLLTTKFYL